MQQILQHRHIYWMK